MFACIGAVKCDPVEIAEMLRDAGVGAKAPHFHRSRLLLPVEAAEDELRHRIGASCRLVRSSLTKKAQAALPPVDG